VQRGNVLGSPAVDRMRMTWARIRGDVLNLFPDSPGRAKSAASCMKQVDALYVSDACNSLSIEGCRVSAELSPAPQGDLRCQFSIDGFRVAGVTRLRCLDVQAAREGAAGRDASAIYRHAARPSRAHCRAAA